MLSWKFEYYLENYLKQLSWILQIFPMLVPILLPVTQICLTGSLYTILAVAIERFFAVTRYVWFSIESYFLVMLIFSKFYFLEHGGNICLPPFAQFAEQTFELLDSKENFNLCWNLSSGQSSESIHLEIQIQSKLITCDKPLPKG